MPAKRGAADRVAPAGTAEDSSSAAILPDAGQTSKQRSLGKCVCGAAIDSNLHTLGCRTCGAWSRWKSAFRIAANALKGPQ